MGFVLAGRSLGAIRSYPAHRHQLWEIIVNTSGEGSVTANGKSFPFKEGTIICIPPHVSHFKEASHGCYTDVYLQFSRHEFIGKDEPFVLEDDEAGTVTSLVNTIQRIYAKDKKPKTICDHLLKAVTELLFARLDTELDPLVDRLVSMMQTSFFDPDFSVSAVVAQSGYCSDHLRRIFKKELGMSPLNYLTALRISHAKKLLSENRDLNYTVSDIARMSGFDDVSYFSRQFKKHINRSPLEFMKLYEKKE